MAILPGDLGIGIEFLTAVFVAIVIAIVIALYSVFWSTKHPRSIRLHPKYNTHPLGHHERIYAITFLIIGLIWASWSMSLLPYPYAHPDLHPTMVVHVQAQQFAWCISNSTSWGTNCQAEIQIPKGALVLFNVSSVDVTHGFGLYKADGHLLDQVQVMPGFYNSIIYQFTAAGIYYIRCIEFCGYGHFGMMSQLNVTAT